MGPIGAALIKVKLLRFRICLLKAIASTYRVGRSTLSRRHQAVTASRATEGLNRHRLSPLLKVELVQYFFGGSKCKAGPTYAKYDTEFASYIIKATLCESRVNRLINAMGIRVVR